MLFKNYVKIAVARGFMHFILPREPSFGIRKYPISIYVTKFHRNWLSRSGAKAPQTSSSLHFDIGIRMDVGVGRKEQGRFRNL